MSEVVKACKTAFAESNASADAGGRGHKIEGYSFSEETPAETPAVPGAAAGEAAPAAGAAIPAGYDD